MCAEDLGVARSNGEQREFISLHDLYLRYRNAVAGVAVETSAGDSGIGTAFFVGDNVFVTARHVLDKNQIQRIFLDDHFDRRELRLADSPIFHPDASIDVAAFKVESVPENTPSLPLGSHLDDWITDEAFVLSKAVILGYPPIPLSRRSQLVAVTAEVNAVVDMLPPQKHVHFVVSAVARGGFSGGPVISEWDFVLGMVTQALLRDNQPEQTGFFTLIGIEAIFNCLHVHGWLPKCQGQGLLIYDR